MGPLGGGPKFQILGSGSQFNNVFLSSLISSFWLWPQQLLKQVFPTLQKGLSSVGFFNGCIYLRWITVVWNQQLKTNWIQTLENCCRIVWFGPCYKGWLSTFSVQQSESIIERESCWESLVGMQVTCCFTADWDFGWNGNCFNWLCSRNDTSFG